MAIIDHIIESAANRYQNGMGIQPAIWAALDECGITDPATRKKLCGDAGRILGKRGGNKTAELKREEIAKKQIPLQFT